MFLKKKIGNDISTGSDYCPFFQSSGRQYIFGPVGSSKLDFFPSYQA